MKIAKSVLVALFAVMSMGTLAATSASAVEPLFLTESGKALLFTADSGESILRGIQGTLEATVKCNEDKIHGFVLDKSPLARELHIEFKGNCKQKVGNGSEESCSEPIKPVLSYGELGLLNGHVLLLVAPETGTEFVELKCGTQPSTKVGGAVIGLFKLNGRDGSSQYGVLRQSFLLLFKSEGGNKIKQSLEEIELLGTLMKGVTLSVEGFLGGKASEETTELVLLNGEGKIDP